MSNLYDEDVIVWAEEQARLLRSRQWSQLDIDTTSPQLRALLADPDCLQDAWLDALLKSIGEANCFDLPDVCPWSLKQAVSDGFFPEE